MKYPKFSAMFLFFIFLGATIFAQEESRPEISAEQMAWMEFMTPGDEHMKLKEDAGEWKTRTKWWMQPDAEPEISTGTAVIEMIMGGRYQKAIHKGTTMGMPMEGMSLVGYDKAKNEYINFWIDNMGTGFSFASGAYDEISNSVEMKGTMSDPVTKKDMSFKAVMKFVDNDKRVFEMYIEQDGKEFKTMEMEYTR